MIHLRPPSNRRFAPGLRSLFTLVIAVVTLTFLLQCDSGSYPYYLSIGDLKPLFITIVDQSGSMNEYQASIRDLVEGSRDRFLSRIYNGDETVMANRYFVVGWPAGESWPAALAAEPSDLMPEAASGLIFANERVSRMDEERYDSFVEELDAYPVRIYLFYGNGGAPNTSGAELENYRSDRYGELSFSRAVLVGVPGSTTEFIDGAREIITSSAGGNMRRYEWHFREYDPTVIEVDAFFDDVMEIILPGS